MNKKLDQIIIDALKLNWGEDWIIAAIKDEDKVSFTVHVKTTYIDCKNVQIDDITLDGNWLRLSGWCYL